LFPLMASFVSGGYTAAIKGAMDLIGFSAGPQSSPCEEVDSDRREILRQRLKSLGFDPRLSRVS